MEHNPDPAIFEHEPEPAMRRAGAAIAAARAHARDTEVLHLLAGAATLVQRAYERQLGLREDAATASGVFPCRQSDISEISPAAADPAKRGARWNP